MQQNLTKGKDHAESYSPTSHGSLPPVTFFKHHPLEQTQRFNGDSTVPQIKILYQDDDFLIVDKPCDMRIDGDCERGHTVVSALLYHHPTLTVPLRNVHQLDHATSGCYCLALTPLAASLACTAFAERRVQKVYLAMVRGWMMNDSYIVEQPIAEVPTNRYKMCIGNENNRGRAAKTEIIVYRRGYFNPNSYPSSPSSPFQSDTTKQDSHIPVSLVRLHPITGRRHQLRLHCQYLGHPIVGDWHYEKEITNYTDTFRMMLHSKRLVIPLDGRGGKKQRRLNRGQELKVGAVLEVETEDPFLELVLVVDEVNKV